MVICFSPVAYEAVCLRGKPLELTQVFSLTSRSPRAGERLGVVRPGPAPICRGRKTGSTGTTTAVAGQRRGTPRFRERPGFRTALHHRSGLPGRGWLGRSEQVDPSPGQHPRTVGGDHHLLIRNIEVKYLSYYGFTPRLRKRATWFSPVILESMPKG